MEDSNQTSAIKQIIQPISHDKDSVGKENWHYTHWSTILTISHGSTTYEIGLTHQHHQLQHQKK